MDVLEVMLQMKNRRGLHARASAKFVKCVEVFKADIQVEKDGMSVSARSIMGLMMLGASFGTEVKVTAVGEDAGQALEALRYLTEERFGEEY